MSVSDLLLSVVESELVKRSENKVTKVKGDKHAKRTKINQTIQEDSPSSFATTAHPSTSSTTNAIILKYINRQNSPIQASTQPLQVLNDEVSLAMISKNNNTEVVGMPTPSLTPPTSPSQNGSCPSSPSAVRLQKEQLEFNSETGSSVKRKRQPKDESSDEDDIDEDSGTSSPSISIASTPSDLKSQRVACHLASEKRRRAKINDGFESLRKLVPSCQPCHSKAQILKMAAQYITDIKHTSTSNMLQQNSLHPHPESTSTEKDELNKKLSFALNYIESLQRQKEELVNHICQLRNSFPTVPTAPGQTVFQFHQANVTSSKQSKFPQNKK